jgi:hypothetical protein
MRNSCHSTLKAREQEQKLLTASRFEPATFHVTRERVTFVSPRPSCDFVEIGRFRRIKNGFGVFGVEEFIFVISFSIHVIVEKVE